MNFMCAQSINPGNLFLKKGREPVLNSASLVSVLLGTRLM